MHAMNAHITGIVATGELSLILTCSSDRMKLTVGDTMFTVSGFCCIHWEIGKRSRQLRLRSLKSKMSH